MEEPSGNKKSNALQPVGTFPNNLDRFIRHLGLQKAQLAKALGVSPGTLSHYITGRRAVPDDRRAVFSRLLKRSIDELFPSPEKILPQNSRQKSEIPRNDLNVFLQEPWLQEFGPTRTDDVFSKNTIFSQLEVFACSELQLPIQRSLLAMDISKTHESQEQQHYSRRQILTALAAMPLSLLAFEPSFSLLPDPEVFLPQCATSLVACNHLLKSQDFWYVQRTLAHILPSLSEIFSQISPYQTLAANLLSQCYLLLGILESHRLNWSEYKTYNERALQMSLLTQESNLQVVSLVQLAMTFFHFEQPTKALSIFQRAVPLVKESTPLIQSNFYTKQAVVYAQAGFATETWHNLEQAHRCFPQQPEIDPGSLVTDFGRPSLASWETKAQLLLAKQQFVPSSQIWNLLSQVDQVSLESSKKVRAYMHNLRAEAGLVIDDLELCVCALSAGIQDARQLKSARRYQEAMDCYRVACTQWPAEVRLEHVAELFVEGKG